MLYTIGNICALINNKLVKRFDPYNPLNLPANTPTSHNNTFKNCGRDTTTGAAELAQIPSD